MNTSGKDIVLTGIEGNKIRCIKYPFGASDKKIFYISPKKPCVNTMEYNELLNAFALTYEIDSPETLPYLQVESVGPAEWVETKPELIRYYVYPSDILVKRVEPGQTSVWIYKNDVEAVNYLKRFISASTQLVPILLLGFINRELAESPLHHQQRGDEKEADSIRGDKRQVVYVDSIN